MLSTYVPGHHIHLHKLYTELRELKVNKKTEPSMLPSGSEHTRDFSD